MLLFRPPRGALIPKQRLLDRFQMFARGEWNQLLLASRECCEKALSASIRRQRTQQDTLERWAERAQTMVLMGEVSAGRRVLEGAPLAPGTEATLKKMRQRPSAPREPLLAEFSRQPDSLFLLDHQEFLKNLKTARRGGGTWTVRDDRRTRETAH